MSSRAAGATLEIVRVLCMHMGDDIIFFIANAWPPHTPPVVPLDLCVILHDSSKKMKKKKQRKSGWKKKEMKIRCDFWPLPGSSHAYRWQQSMAHRGRKRERERERLACSHATCHTHSHTQTVAECSYIYAHIARQRSATHIHFSNAFLMPHTTRSRLYLAALLPVFSLFPSPLLLLSFSFLCCSESFNHIRHITQNAKHEDWQNK